MRYSEDSDLSFYSDKVSSKQDGGCRVSRLGVFLIILAFIIGLLVVGLTVGLAGRPTCSYTTLPPPLHNVTTAAPPTSPPPGGDTSYRLPRTLYPTHYDVTLVPDLHNKVFNGSVRIEMRCAANTTNITMHLQGLTINALTLVHAPTQRPVPLHPWELDTKRLFLIVNVDEELMEGEQYELSVSYTGELLNNRVGLYMGSYKDSEGQVSWSFNVDEQLVEGEQYKLSISYTRELLNNKLEIQCNEQLVKGEQYDLRVSSTGELLNNRVGLYMGSFKDSDEQVRYFAATQFESTRARRALPCFDEPLFKSEFSVTIGHLPNHTALSNMPSVGTVLKDGWVYESFNRTVPMSIYLLAMYVGDLDNRTISTNLSIEMRVWVRSASINKTQYIQGIADTQMDGFQKFFDIPYTLPKMDHLGLPEMGAGAMENWGLIRYSEKYLVVDETSTPDAHQAAVLTVAHELGHQWFGNLVTMEWWDDIWLNEGFANLCEYIGVEFVHPEWKPWEQFIVETQYPAMAVDSLRNSRIIRRAANTPNEISANFDMIAYFKGSTLMLMLRDVMGHEPFRRGITRYLNKHKFENTVSDDLWEALTEQMTEEGNPLNVTTMMHPWTLQMNYPLVTVTRDYTDQTARVGQSRFLLDTHGDTPDVDGAAPEFGYTWEVQLSYTDQTAQNWDNPTKTWMHRDNVTLVGVASNSDWLLVNVRRSGMYRVNYDAQNWDLLTEQLLQDHTVFPTENRAQILDDAFQLARAGLMSQSAALNISRYLMAERELVPWRTAEEFFTWMYELLAQTEVYGDFKGYMVQLVSPLLEELGWEDEGEHLERMLRLTAVRLACKFEHPVCVNKASKQYAQWMQTDINSIPEGFREVVYCSAIRAGGEQEWDYAWTQYQNETDPIHRGDLRDAMTCTGQQWLLARYISWFSDTSKVSRVESSIVLVGIARNPSGRRLAWDYIQQSWETLSGKMRIASEAFDGFYTETDLKQLAAFRDGYSDVHGYSSSAVSAAVEKAWVSHRWMTRTLDDMGAWFKQVTAEV